MYGFLRKWGYNGRVQKAFSQPIQDCQTVVRGARCSLTLLPVENAPPSCLASLPLDRCILPVTGHFSTCRDLLGITWPPDIKGSKCSSDHAVVICRCCTTKRLCPFEAGLLLSGKCIYQETWQQRHWEILRVLILQNNPQISGSSFSFKICFPLQWMVLAVSLLFTYNLGVPLSFSDIGAVEFLQFSLQAAVSGGFLRAVSGCV